MARADDTALSTHFAADHASYPVPKTDRFRARSACRDVRSPPIGRPPGRFASLCAAIVIMTEGFSRGYQRASTANSNRATMLVILIIGFTAGPAVSL